ncbi:hypothetical protein MTO96_049255 [Rhipicephalus appendiculatus]
MTQKRYDEASVFLVRGARVPRAVFHFGFVLRRTVEKWCARLFSPGEEEHKWSRRTERSDRKSDKTQARAIGDRVIAIGRAASYP